MKRPLCIATIFYIIGILIGLYLQLSIAFLLFAWVIITIISYLTIKRRCIVVFLIILLLGTMQVKLVDMKYEEKYELIEQTSINKVKAIIVSEPQEKEYKIVYEVKIVEVENTELKKYDGTHWLLNIKKSTNVKLQSGDMIEFIGKFEIPNEARNYKGFDYKQYLKSQGIYGNITLKNETKVIENNKESINEKIFYYISSDIKNKLKSLIPEDINELCIGILIGDRKNISEEITNVFKESNLTHMLAISGAHIAYVILGVTMLLSKTEIKFRKTITILFLLFFIGITGGTPSVIRASIMAILTIIASIVQRKADIYNDLAVSAILTLMWNPYTILNIGFQLSYVGTIGIVMFNGKISRILKEKLNINEASKIDRKTKEKNIKLKEKLFIFTKKIFIYIIDLFSLTISANLAILPIMALNFHTISLTFWISNILAGPFLGFILILGYITYFISFFSNFLANVISFPLEVALRLLIQIAKICSKLPLNSIIIKRPYLFEILFYYIVIIIISYHRKIQKNLKMLFISTIIIILLIGYIICFFQNQRLRIYFVDVGQGDCTLICTPGNKTILIDGGGSENSNFDVGENTLFPYLLNRRISKIDYIMISHFDSDHIGGLFYILEHLEVKNIIISKQAEISKNYLKLKSIVEKKKINIIIAKQGNRIQIDRDIYFDILFPEEEMILENVLNNNSIVSKLVYKNFSMLFTGDIEKETESKIVKLYSDNLDILKSTILKVPHHGSNSSSTDEFLRLVQPKIALIGVGNNNLYGHPNNEVIERLKKLRSYNL